MQPNEVIEFFELLDQSCEALGKPVKSESAKGLFLELLGGYGLANLRGAVLAHMRDPERGRFPPAPADLQAQIEKAMQKDGGPGADEAWAIAVQLQDESATVVTTEEISQAWAVARDIMPDRTGARMAFRSAYERICAESRQNGSRLHWFASVGTDPQGREGALLEAARKGLLTHDHIRQFLPAPEAVGPMLKIVYSVKTGEAKQEIERMRKLLSKSTQGG